MADEVTLPFKTCGLYWVRAYIDGKPIMKRIEDSLIFDPVTDEILNAQIYDDTPGWYLQRVTFGTDGESPVEVYFYYRSHGSMQTSHCTLVRK